MQKAKIARAAFTYDYIVRKRNMRSGLYGNCKDRSSKSCRYKQGKSARGQGVGTGLIQKAIEWAKKSNLNGLALETQDNNLLACLFYAKCGFVIGAVNTMLYKNFYNEEFAVFGYLRF